MKKKLVNTLLLIALSLLAVSGCSKKEPPTCEAVVAHLGTFRTIADEEKDGYMKRCEHATPEARICAINAKSAGEIGECYNKK